jgi:hypothetical protein
MKRYTQLLGAGVLALATAGLGGCFGNGGGNGGTASTPPSKPQPEQPTRFRDFVHGKFDSSVRDSETAKPQDVGSFDFKFADKPDPHAYDDLLKDSSGG